MRKYVYLGTNTSYYRRNIEASSRKYDFIFYSETPDNSLKGLKWLLYKIHNSGKINSIIKLPFRSIWASKIIDDETKKVLKKDEQIVFCFSDIAFSYYKMGVIPYLRKTYPNCIICYMLNDKVDYYKKLIKDFNAFIAMHDYIFTYNKTDAELYNFPLLPPEIGSYDDVECTDDTPCCDVFFVGSDRGRLAELVRVYDICDRHGLICDFNVVKVPEERQIVRKGIRYNEYIPYDEVLRRVKGCKAVLNIVQEGVEGITLRDYEAIGLNKILITNGTVLLNSDLYTPEKVIELDKLEEQLNKILNQNIHNIWNNTEKYSVTNRYVWIENQLDKTQI